MIKFLYGLIVLLLVVLVITKPYISVTESTFNYGELGRNKRNIGEIYITNRGLLPLRIYDCSGCCGLEANTEKNILKHNERAKVTFDYNSLEVSPGEFNKTIIIVNNDIFQRNKIINIKGKVVGELILE